MEPDYHTMTTDLLNAGIGDKGRLKFILECIQNDKPLYNTDAKYLKKKYDTFETKLKILSGKKTTSKIPSHGTLDRIVDEALDRKSEKHSEPVSSQKKKSFFAKIFKKRH